MPGLYTITTRSLGELITAAVYNADQQNHVDNQTPQMTDDYSTNAAQMQSVVDPGDVGTESLPTSLAGEIERLRFVIKEITGGAQWYSSAWPLKAALGSAAAPSYSFTGRTNTGAYSSAADTFDISAGGVRAASFLTAASAVNYLTITPAAAGNGPVIDCEGSDSDISVAVDTKGTGSFQIRSGGTQVAAFSAGAVTISSADAGATGPIVGISHLSASPADGDTISTIRFNAKDDLTVERICGQITMTFDDVTSTEMDTTMLFFTMNACNQINANTVASLTPSGVWTDASAAAGKEYIGDVSSILSKARGLKTLGVYRGAGVPVGKQATAELHYSPTAEEFYKVFGLGMHPSKTKNPGIAAKDVAWLAIKGLIELEARVAALETDNG